MEVRKISFDQQPEIDEFVEQIDDQTFCLVPDAHHNMTQLWEQKYGFAKLNEVSQAEFKRPEILLPEANQGQSEGPLHPQEVYQPDFNQRLHKLLKGVLPKDLCQLFIQQAQQDKAALYHSQFINSLLPLILSDEIDQLLCSYFRSEYSMFWYSYVESDHNTESVSHLWHCDGCPQNYLKILVYLNDYPEHLGNTKFMRRATSDKLKEVGYIYGSLAARKTDLTGLAAAKDFALNEVMYEDIEAGDGLLFNPTLLAHRGKIPEVGTRHVLQLCFLPSPFHWSYTAEHVLKPRSTEFERVVEVLLNHWRIQQKANPVQPLAIEVKGNITSMAQLELLLKNIFPNSVFASLMFLRLKEADPKLEHLVTLQDLLETLKGSFRSSINWRGDLGMDNVNNLLQMATYEQQLIENVNRYSLQGKPNPQAVFWPSPVHPDKPASKYQLLPYVQKHPILDLDTPIGSAGSCFAFEIARVFQEQGYNYIVTERNDDPAAGLVVDGYTPFDKIAKFSANYGILFNTPSFRQLAERAFGVKQTRQVVFQQPNGCWADPYRENVLFTSYEAYVNDYDRHIKACRESLERSEVFIITLGLNECWQFKDGSVMSRNPRNNMYPMVNHRTLTVAENVENIQLFFNIVKQHNPKFKLIISVSPIPFLATGRAKEHHIISANCHSKSVLRVAAEQLVNSNPDMYYLPSYELVMECLEDAWGPDHRHVTPQTVEKVVAMFNEIFFIQQTDTPHTATPQGKAAQQ